MRDHSVGGDTQFGAGPEYDEGTMPIVHTDRPSLIDVLDRVLDKGIVIDSWMRESFGGIDLMTITSRVMAASFETCLAYSVPLAQMPIFATPGGISGPGWTGTADHRPPHRPARNSSPASRPRPVTRLRSHRHSRSAR